MKQVLSLLVAFVFMHVQTWALSGGPDYNSQSQIPDSLIGTYAAVLQPTGGTDEVVPGGGLPSPASIGVLTISVFEQGTALGAAIIFVQGTAFVGQVGGIADADKSTINGVIAGTSTFDVVEEVQTGETTSTDPNTGVVTVTPTFTQVTFPIFAQGNFQTTVVPGLAGGFTAAQPGSGSAGGSTSTATTATSLEIGSTKAARLEGSAEVGTFFHIDSSTGAPIITRVLKYSIDGLKQTNIPSDVTDIGISFSSGNNGGT